MIKLIRRSKAQEFVQSLIDTYNPATVLPVIGDDGRYHFIYLTYHKESYKFYLGKHSTPNYEDGYIGSGTHFKRALDKHGSQSFVHARLLFLLTEEEAYKQEAELVNEALIKKYREELKVCYNLKTGGLGGSVYRSQETRDKMSQSLKEAKARPDVKAKISQASKESHARPEVKAKLKEAWARPEYQAKISQSLKEANARPEVKAKRSQSLKEAHAIKELVNPDTGETKEVHWREMLPFLKDGWQLTSKVINLYNPNDNNRRTTVNFERPNRKVDKEKAYERLIKLLDSNEGWQVGEPPKGAGGGVSASTEAEADATTEADVYSDVDTESGEGLGLVEVSKKKAPIEDFPGLLAYIASLRGEV